MLNSFSKFIINHPRIILSSVFIISLFFSFFIPNLKIDFSIEHLFSQKDPGVEKYFSFRDTFGREDNVLTIIYKPTDVFEKQLYIELEELVYGIEELDGVKNVISIFTLSDIDLNAWLGNLHDDYFPWDKDTIFKKLSYIQQDPSIGCRVISKNLQYGSIIISLKDNANNHGRRTELLEEIKILTSKTSAEWTYSGVSVLRTEYVRYMLRDNFIFLPPIAVIFISILSFIFRNWVYVLLPTLTVIITVIWLLGFMGIFGLEINIMTYIVPTLLIIIGISDAIHIQARFRENFIKYRSDPLEAMLTTMNQMTKVIFLTSVTTAIGFLALMTTSIQIVREFGMEISIGVMFAWLVSILIVPSGIIFSQQFKVRKKDTFEPFLIWLSRIIPNNPWAFIIVPSLISAICIYKIKDISTDSSLMDDLRPKNKLYQDLKLTEKNFGGVLPFEILVKTKSKEMKQNEVPIDSEVLQLSKIIQQLLESELKNSRFFSVNNLLESAKRIQAGNKASVSDEILLNQIIENQSSGQINLINEGRDVLRITGLIEDKTSNEMKQIYTKLDSLSDIFSEKVSIDYTGTTVVALNTNDYLVQALVNSLGLALIFISIIMAIMFRTNSILFASLVTNLIPIFSVLGILAWLGISIRPPTAMTFAVALGIAVDDSLHFLLRYRRELRNGLNRVNAIKATIIHTGSALLITTSILVAGFSVLLLSAFLPTYQFGLLSAVMVGTALLCDLTLLPALCLILPNPRKNEN
ncbi:MAG: hypothetical protein CMG57_05020 [Candidatus Marinimicrobia bacterium]|nr:hypothetical protein [Candidatus Neomarinimicrobiota bacterium]